MENIINELKNGNTEQAVCLTLKLFDIDQNIIMYNYDVIHLVYIFSAQHDNNPKEYFDYLILLNQKEEEKFQVHFNIIKSFALFLRQLGTKKSDFLLEYMFEHKMADPIIVQYLHSFYFAHYNFKSTINQYLPYEFDIDKLKANDWVLHKTLVHEGFTQNEIMEIIRNDDVNKLQEISSQAGFKLNQEITYSYFDIYFHEIDYNHDSAKVTLIDYAAFFGSIKCFKYLLMNGADVSNSGKYAIASGNLEIVHLCEQNHSSFEYAYETAIQFHRNDIFNYLYENKLEELNHLTKLGIKCIEYYNYQILSFLESKGMTVDSELITKLAENGNLFFMKYFIKKVEMPKNILESAVKSGNIELVKFILQQKDINKNEDLGFSQVIYLACKLGYLDIFKLLLKQKGIKTLDEIYNSRNSYISIALKQGNFDIVKTIIKKKLYYDIKNDCISPPFIIACRRHYAEVVKLFIEQGVDVNVTDKKGQTALFLESKKGFSDIFKILLNEPNIDVNAKNNKGLSPLQISCYRCHVDLVKLLLEHKDIDVNSQDNIGRTPLIMSCGRTQNEINRILFDEKGIELIKLNNDERLSYMHEFANGYEEIVKMLLEHKEININIQDKDGETALIKSCSNNDINILKLLLEFEGIDINVKNVLGKTALMKAAEKGYTQIVKLLLEQEGIDINAKDNDGKTVYDCAKTNFNMILPKRKYYQTKEKNCVIN